MVKPQRIDYAARKAKIARGFSLAAQDYDDFAGAQEQIAHTALSLIPHDEYTCALDIGCGTGRHTFALVDYCKQVTGVDLAPGMITQAQQQYPAIRFLEGMAEQLPIEENCVGLVFSSMALQWCLSPLQVMSEIFRVMRNKGTASLAIMVAGSFEELTRARLLAGQPNTINPLASADVWWEAACQAGFGKVESQIKSYTVHFSHVLPLLKSIKHVGAGTLVDGAANQQFKFSRQRLNRLNLAYQGEATADARLPLTYRVCHLVMEK